MLNKHTNVVINVVANLLTIHAHSVTLQQKDLVLLRQLKGHMVGTDRYNWLKKINSLDYLDLGGLEFLRLEIRIEELANVTIKEAIRNSISMLPTPSLNHRLHHDA